MGIRTYLPGIPRRAPREPLPPRTPVLRAGGHIPALDGLRGIAVLAVMVYHFFLFGGALPVHRVDRLLQGLALAGWSGVDLFLVLSGFLITGILYDTRHQAGFFQTFYMRRLLRIFPLYYGVLVICFFVLPRLAPLLRVAGDTQLWAWSYLTNLVIAGRGWQAMPEYLGHFWSLALEEQFYLVWPLLVFRLSRRGLLRVCGGMVAGSLLLRIWLVGHGNEVAAYVLTPARMDALAIGAALALAARDPSDLRVVLRWAKPVLAGALVLLAAIYGWRHGLSDGDPVVATAGFTLLDLTFGAVLILAVTGAGAAWLPRALAWAPLRFFGKYSYALYVFHHPIVFLLPAIGISAVTLSPVPGWALPGELAFTAVATALTVAVSLVSWHAYEKHFLRLKDRFAYAGPPAAVAPPVPETLRGMGGA